MILFCYISYYCLDVARGESLDYAAEIAKKFNTEFPKARLTISYDIACKLKNIFAVIIILSLRKSNYPVFHQVENAQGSKFFESCSGRILFGS